MLRECIFNNPLHRSGIYLSTFRHRRSTCGELSCSHGGTRRTAESHDLNVSQADQDDARTPRSSGGMYRRDVLADTLTETIPGIPHSHRVMLKCTESNLATRLALSPRLTSIPCGEDAVRSGISYLVV